MSDIQNIPQPKAEASVTPQTSPTVNSNPNALDFVGAIKAITEGKSITKMEWNSKEDYCLMKDGYLMVHSSTGFHTWLIRDVDVAGKDWIVI